MPTRNLAILFTDIKGFTERTSHETREGVRQILAAQDRLLIPAFRYFEGRVVKTIGDAFLVCFESGTDAVLCGVAIQEILRQHNAAVPEKERLEVRIAINQGDVELRDGDVFGEPVNLAARLEGITEAGEIYFTEAVFLSMNRTEVPSAVVGERTFKGIPYAVRVYRVTQDPGAPEAKRFAEAIRLTPTGPVITGLRESIPVEPKGPIAVPHRETAPRSVTAPPAAGAPPPSDSPMSWTRTQTAGFIFVFVGSVLTALVARKGGANLSQSVAKWLLVSVVVWAALYATRKFVLGSAHRLGARLVEFQAGIVQGALLSIIFFGAMHMAGGILFKGGDAKPPGDVSTREGRDFRWDHEGRTKRRPGGNPPAAEPAEAPAAPAASASTGDPAAPPVPPVRPGPGPMQRLKQQLREVRELKRERLRDKNGAETRGDTVEGTP